MVENGGADVNKEDKRGKTAVLIAVRRVDKRMVQYLVEKCGADINPDLYDVVKSAEQNIVEY